MADMTFDPVYGARTDQAYLDSLQQALDLNAKANPNMYGGMSLQQFDQSINPQSYYARWGGGNENITNAPSISYDISSGMSGLQNIQNNLNNSFQYTPTAPSPVLTSTPGLQNVFNPSNTQYSGQSNLQNLLQPLQQQLKSLQSLYQTQGTAGAPTGGYTSGSYTNPQNLAGLYPTKSMNLNNSRGARYFNQSTDSYETGNTGTSQASF